MLIDKLAWLRRSKSVGNDRYQDWDCAAARSAPHVQSDAASAKCEKRMATMSRRAFVASRAKPLVCATASARRDFCMRIGPLRAHSGSLQIWLRALAARKSPQMLGRGRCTAAGIPLSGKAPQNQSASNHRSIFGPCLTLNVGNKRVLTLVHNPSNIFGINWSAVSVNKCTIVRDDTPFDKSPLMAFIAIGPFNLYLQLNRQKGAIKFTKDRT